MFVVQTIIMVLAVAVFLFILIQFIRTFWQTRRFTDRIFRQVEQRLDRAEAGPLTCGHCGSQVAEEKTACPNCGAPLE